MWVIFLGPPWSRFAWMIDVDRGADLLPHRFTAIEHAHHDHRFPTREASRGVFRVERRERPP